MFKVRMQGQYGAKTDKRLRDVVKEMWSQWGFRKGLMRGYWVINRLSGDPPCPNLNPSQVTVIREIPGYAGCVVPICCRLL